jgi:hypothetical protein
MTRITHGRITGTTMLLVADAERAFHGRAKETDSRYPKAWPDFASRRGFLVPRLQVRRL